MITRRTRAAVPSFGAAGPQTTPARNGQEALDLLRDHDFDVLLLDIIMPTLNGYETLRRIKADERLRHLPVIMISALDEMESVIRCIELGADDYLPKPFDPVLLQARIGQAWRKATARPGNGTVRPTAKQLPAIKDWKPCATT